MGNYVFQDIIGKGKYADVYLGTNKETGKQVAIKKLLRKGVSSNQLKNISNEVYLLSKVNHPNIVSMVDKMKSSNHYYLMLEYCNGGDLNNLLTRIGL